MVESFPTLDCILSSHANVGIERCIPISAGIGLRVRVSGFGYPPFCVSMETESILSMSAGSTAEIGYHEGFGSEDLKLLEVEESLLKEIMEKG